MDVKHTCEHCGGLKELTVGELKKALENVPDNLPVVLETHVADDVFEDWREAREEDDKQDGIYVPLAAIDLVKVEEKEVLFLVAITEHEPTPEPAKAPH